MYWTRLVWGGAMKSGLKLVILIRAIFEKLCEPVLQSE